MDVPRRFDISSQTGDARDDAFVQNLPHQGRFRFIAPDGAIRDTAKCNRGPLDDAIVVRLEQDCRSGHRKISVPPRVLLE